MHLKVIEQKVAGSLNLIFSYNIAAPKCNSIYLCKKDHILSIISLMLGEHKYWRGMWLTQNHWKKKKVSTLFRESVSDFGKSITTSQESTIEKGMN